MVSPVPFKMAFIGVRGKDGGKDKKERFPFCKACVIRITEDWGKGGKVFCNFKQIFCLHNIHSFSPGISSHENTKAF